MTTLQTGHEGEKKATEYLQNLGFTILETNWSNHHKEIDIIARHKGFIVFVEVKTRKAGTLMPPASAIDRQKQKNLIWAANSYIRHKNIDLEARFDIVTLLYKGTDYQIEHIQDAFYPRLK